MSCLYSTDRGLLPLGLALPATRYLVIAEAHSKRIGCYSCISSIVAGLLLWLNRPEYTPSNFKSECGQVAPSSRNAHCSAMRLQSFFSAAQSCSLAAKKFCKSDSRCGNYVGRVVSHPTVFSRLVRNNAKERRRRTCFNNIKRALAASLLLIIFIRGKRWQTAFLLCFLFFFFGSFSVVPLSSLF